MILNSLLKGTIVIICLLHLILYSLILLGLYNQWLKVAILLLLWALLWVCLHDDRTPISCRKDWTKVDLHLWKIWKKDDQSKFVATMIMNSKKFSLDDDDSEASNEASFNLWVVEDSQHLTYDSLLNLQYLHVAILKNLQLYLIVPMVRTHTKHVILIFKKFNFLLLNTW